MNLKGCATIQLFDGENGKEIERIREENMVTNTLNNLANHHKFFYGYFTHPSWLKGLNNVFRPLATNALGGVMCFENQIPEVATIGTPTVDNKVLAHAGTPYSGTKATRGTYNETESGAYLNGYRQVWDFSTDKGNGVISCIGLTSNYGGDVGFLSSNVMENTNFRSSGLFNHGIFTHGVAKDESVFQLFLNNSKGDASDIPLDYFKIFYLSEIGTKGECFVLAYTPSKEMVYKLEFIDPAYITLLGTGYKASYNDVPPTTTEHFSVGSGQTSIYFMDGHIHVVSQMNSTTIRHDIRRVDGSLVSTKTITTPLICKVDKSYYLPFYFDGKYVVYNNANGYPTGITATGEVIGEINAVNSQVVSVCYDQYTDCIITTSDVSRYNSIQTLTLYGRGDNIKLKIRNANNWSPSIDGYNARLPYQGGFIYSPDLKAPCYIYAIATHDSGTADFRISFYAQILNSYLATINNLSMPIEKTSAQTMKITYEITQE